MSAIEFLRDLGKHFSVNVMLDRDTIRRRLEGEGISYTEFSYMLLQANDYVELHQRHGCTLQIGGSDQWGNIIAGVRLVRQKLGASVHALTVPLVTAADGTKFGKSTGGGSLWLDPQMTSPYAWYQYFVNTADADVIRYLRWFTFLSADELAELQQATAERPQQRAAQRRLAAELTTLVHGEEATAAVEHASQALFGRGELDRLDESTLAAALRETAVAELKPGGPDGIVDLLVASGLSDSRGAARRTIGEGGAYGQQRPHRQRRMGAPAFGLPARLVGSCCAAASATSQASNGSGSRQQNALVCKPLPHRVCGVTLLDHCCHGDVRARRSLAGADRGYGCCGRLAGGTDPRRHDGQRVPDGSDQCRDPLRPADNRDGAGPVGLSYGVPAGRLVRLDRNPKWPSDSGLSHDAAGAFTLDRDSERIARRYWRRSCRNRLPA